MSRAKSAQRAKILEAAVRVFGSQGLEGATIRDVGRAAGVNSALMYYYFENKEQLFEEAVRRVIEGFLESLVAAQRSFRSGRERLEYLVDTLLRYYSLHPDRMALMACVLTRYPERMGVFLSGLLRAGPVLPIAVLQEGMDAGQLRPMNPIHAWWNVLSLCVFSFFMRAVIRHLDAGHVTVPEFDLQERQKSIVDLLVGGMATESRPGHIGGPKHVRRRV